jgi:hypothetical protein
MSREDSPAHQVSGSGDGEPGLSNAWRDEHGAEDGEARLRVTPASDGALFAGSPPQWNGRSRRGARFHHSNDWQRREALARPAGLEPATPGLEGRFWHSRVAMLGTTARHDPHVLSMNPGLDHVVEYPCAHVVSRAHRAAPHP